MVDWACKRTPINLFLFSSTDGEIPNVIVNPPVLNPTLGTSASFQCRPEGRGPFNVVWSRTDRRSMPGRSSQGPGPDYLLTIDALEYSDSARYQCSVTNAYGTSRAFVQLNVEGKGSLLLL